ncbi:cupredoxin domain-containing protein [Microbulbifer agarilyticus]
MATLLINLLGLIAIAAIVWWFWIAPRKQRLAAIGADAQMQVLVKDGVYSPDRIRVPANEKTVLHFLREDPSPCAEWVLFPDLEVSAQLGVDQVTEITVYPKQAGEYPFHCQMQMYRGTLVAE